LGRGDTISRNGHDRQVRLWPAQRVINQTRRVEVYTKRRTDDVITKAWLDINNVQAHGLTRIEEPETADLPEFVQRYLKDNNLTFDHGTVVVWVMPDRLSYRKASTLKEHLLDDFGVVYRYMLGDVTLSVSGKMVEAVDPLFLTPGARYYVPKDKGGAIESYKQMIPVRYYQDEETGVSTCRTSKGERPRSGNEKTLAVGAIEVELFGSPLAFSVHRRARPNPTPTAGSRSGRRGAECRLFDMTAKSRRSTSFRGRCATSAPALVIGRCSKATPITGALK